MCSSISVSNPIFQIKGADASTQTCIKLRNPQILYLCTLMQDETTGTVQYVNVASTLGNSVYFTIQFTDLNMYSMQSTIHLKFA